METGAFVAWYTGKVITCSAIIVCIVASLGWIFSECKGYIFCLPNWTEDRLHKVSTTYAYLTMSFLLASTSIAYTFESPAIMQIMSLYPNTVIFSTIVIMTALTTLLEVVPYQPQYQFWKNSLWIAHSVSMGPSLAYFGSHISSLSSISTSFALILATSISFVGPRDLYIFLEHKLSYVYILVTTASVLCILFSPPTTAMGVFLISINFYGGMLLYFFVYVVNTQFFLNETRKSEFDPIYTSCVMFLCALNLYLRVAMYYVVELTNLTDPRDH